MSSAPVAYQVGQFLMNDVANAFALPFEKSFEPTKYITFARENWSLAFGLVSAYLLFLIVGSKMMKNREPFGLNTALGIWSGALCLFSFLGMCRTVPYLLGMILTQSYDQTVCENGFHTWGSGPSGFWVMLFIFSKVPELIDTVFIVLRKKPLIFLHWYHHVTVLLFCWSSFATLASSGLYFVAMNYTVHALMYGYYSLQALKCLPKSFPTPLITIMQISQMFVGTGVCISCWYYKLTDFPCANDKTNLQAGALMYASYLYLFVEFAVKKYIFPPKKAPKEKTV